MRTRSLTFLVWKIVLNILLVLSEDTTAMLDSLLFDEALISAMLDVEISAGVRI